MCTVTYINNIDTVILTSNRDENTKRKKAAHPKLRNINGHNILSPIDTEAGGSWIGVSEKGRISCLLNGGFEKHLKTENYRKSRGLVFFDSFLFDELKLFATQYDFENIEPFTLITIETTPFLELIEFRWTGKEVFFERKDPNTSHIWSSSTLYNKEIRSKREIWFRDLLNTSAEPNSDTLLNFHFNGGNTEPANEKINVLREDGIRTISTTQIVSSPSLIQMIHHNHLNKIRSTEEIKLYQTI